MAALATNVITINLALGLLCGEFELSLSLIINTSRLTATNFEIIGNGADSESPEGARQTSANAKY